MKHALLAILLLGACGRAGTRVDLGSDDPRRDRAATDFAIAEGLDVSLFAAEPLLVNPTNMDIDERGRVWVTEAVNYRPDYNPHHKTLEAGDRIVVLEDTDGDGRADERTVFHQGTDIDAALGIMVVGGKVYVSSSPYVFVFIDEDGDGRADGRDTLYTGIGGRQDDHGVHAFVLGPDGRLAFNFGNAGRRLMDRSGRPVVDRAGNVVDDSGNPYRQGMVFRADLDGSNVEVVGHNFRNVYEVAVDAFGTLWQSDNDDDGNRGVRINYVMEYGNFGYVDELTGAHWTVPRTGMHDDIPLRHWHLNDPGVVPNLLQTGAGSPTGLAVYEGDLLPEVFRGHIVHADAGPGVVRAYPVTASGAGYTAKTVDIVRSDDDRWFRPSDVTVAPDGSLFFADWYDATVGGNQAVDRERGRIYRVAPEGVPYTVPDVDFSDPWGAAVALQSPNLATRSRAFLALRQFGPRAEYALLGFWSGSDPRRRARALWLLGQIEGRGAHYVDEALRDDDPDLRVTGLRLARLLGHSIVSPVERVVLDESPRVRRAAAIALRHAREEKAARLWATLAMQHDGRDRWYLEALGIGADRQWRRYFAAWKAMTGTAWNTPGGRDIVWRARTPEALPYLAELIGKESDPDRYFRALDFHRGAEKYALFEALARHDGVNVVRLALLHLTDPDTVRGAVAESALERVLDAFPGTGQFLDLMDRFRPEGRTDELSAMALGAGDERLATRATRILLAIEGMDPLRETALSNEFVLGRLGRANDSTAVDFLETVALDDALPPERRREAAAALGMSGSGRLRMLSMLRDGEFPEFLSSVAASVLLNEWSVDVRREAEALLGMPADRDAVALPPIRSLVAAVGNPGSGEAVFETHCALCHDVSSGVTVFGPSLSQIGSKISEHALFEAILHPDAGISHGFAGERVTLEGGAQAVGYVESETDDELLLRLSGGITERYAKADIRSRTRLEHSLMPALQAAMTRDELVDLVAYLHGLKQE